MDIRILGLGNVLMGDDGFGPYVIEALNAGYEFPSEVSVVDVGTPGLDLAPFLIDADAIIVVDTVRADAPPGTLRVYPRDALLAHAPQHRLGPHDPGFTQTLLTLDFAGCGPSRVLLVGVVPASIAPRPRLSPTLTAAVPAAIEAVISALDDLGVRATARATPTLFAPWWERGTVTTERHVGRRAVGQLSR